MDGLGNTHNSHAITDLVEGESTHNHDIQLICGAVRGDIVVVRGDPVAARSDLLPTHLRHATKI